MLEKKSKETCEFFAKRLHEAMTARGYVEKLSVRSKVLREWTGSSVQATRKWLNGENLPEAQKMSVIASSLGITIDALLSSSTTMPVVVNFPNTALMVPAEMNMFDDIKKGDILVVEQVLRTVKDGSIFLITTNGLRMFRRLVYTSDGSVLCIDGVGNVVDKASTPEEVEALTSVIVGEVTATIRHL